MTNARIGGLLLLAFCVFYAWKIGDIRLLPFQADRSFTPQTMPIVLAGMGIVLSILIIIIPDRNDAKGLVATFRSGEINWMLGIAFLVLMSVYGLTVRPLGFILSTSLFLIAGFFMLGERSPVKLIAVAVPLVVIFWALMNYGLSVFIEPLPVFLKG